MVARLFSSRVLGFCILFLISSCGEEDNTNREALIGRWEITQGFRNQKETGTLGGTYFLFEKDGKMQTNLPIGPEELMPYELNKNEIRQKSTPPMKYQILSLNDSALILSMELRGMLFEMHFRRFVETPPDSLPSTPNQPDTLSGDSL